MRDEVVAEGWCKERHVAGGRHRAVFTYEETALSSPKLEGHTRGKA